MEPSFLIHWLFPLAVTLHNLEEALWLPGWRARHPVRFQPKVEAGAFRFAVVALTLAAYLLAGWATMQGFGSLPHYLLAGFAFAQGLNIFFPHLVTSLITRSYMPGLASGVLLVLPAVGVYLTVSLGLGILELPRFALTAALMVPALLVSLPLLFRLGAGLRINRKRTTLTP